MLLEMIEDILDKNNNQITESMIDDLKKKIMSILDKIDDVDLLSTIFSLAKKSELETLLDEILKEKNLLSMKEVILNKLITIKGDVELKIGLLEAIKNENVINLDAMLKASSPIVLRSVLEKNIDRDLGERYFWSLANISEGKGNSIGEGEIALIMYIKGATKPGEGDVKFPGGFIEVKFLKNKKSSGGKLVSTKGYKDPAYVFESFIQPKKKKMGIEVKDPNQCNFTTKEIRLYNLLVSNGVSHKDAIKFLEEVVARIFNGEKPDFSMFYNKSKLNVKEFIRVFSIFLFKRYIKDEAQKTGASAKNFYLLFMNAETKKVLPITYNDIEKKIDFIRVTGTISFKEGAQSPTFRYAIV